jgi:cytochrome d ubiquinol oxidase subunit I
VHAFPFLLAAEAHDLLAARVQMGVTLAFHIVLAVLGIGMPLLMLIAEWRFLRTRDELWRTLAQRWSKAFAVLFAVGAVSGTVLSFELGLLWPAFMGRFGSVIGLPFLLEGFAFFLEGIFVAIYLYGWERLRPWAHWWCGVPIALSGAISAWFIVTVNAWMNAPNPDSMHLDAQGLVVAVNPIATMLGATTAAQTTHMILAAYVVAGFLIASVYAVGILRGQRSEYHRRALGLSLGLGAVVMPVQILVGDWSARVVVATQPVKFAAMEGQFQTQRHAPLRIGGVPDEQAGTTRFALEIPGGLSWLAYRDTNAEVLGLNDVAPDDRPPAAVVHISFQIMILGGFALLALSVCAGWSTWRRKRLPDSRGFLLAAALSGPLSILAMEAGWVVTEVGRQPWIVQGVARTRDMVTDAPGVIYVLYGTLAIYTVLLIGMTAVLRLLARRPIPNSSS